MKPSPVFRLLLSAMFVLAASAAGAAEVKVGLVLQPVSHPFWRAVRDGAEEAAAKFPDLDLSIRAPVREINAEQQTQLVEDEIAAGAKVLIVAPVDEVQLMPALAEAHAKGVKVIILESDMPWPDKAAFVGPNNVMGGYAAADYIVNRLNGVGKVAIISGVFGQGRAINRTNGAREAFRRNRGITLVAVRSAGWERYRAMTEMESLLAIEPGLDAVFCCDDEMALGALEAIRAAEAKAFVVGFGATGEALRSIADGGLAATIAQDAFTTGRLAVSAGYRLAGGRSVPPLVDTGFRLVTAEDVGEFLK